MQPTEYTYMRLPTMLVGRILHTQVHYAWWWCAIQMIFFLKSLYTPKLTLPSSPCFSTQNISNYIRLLSPSSSYHSIAYDMTLENRNDVLTCWIGPTNCQLKWLRTRSAEIRHEEKYFWLLISYYHVGRWIVNETTWKNHPQTAVIGFWKLNCGNWVFGFWILRSLRCCF